MSCGVELEANSLIAALTTDASFDIPKIDLSGAEFKFPVSSMGQEIKPLKVEDLTNGHTDGAGVFDALMRGFKAHLAAEYESGRITGNDYTKAYIALTESAMSQGIAFMLGKDNAFWQAQLAQVQAYTARIGLEEAKVRLAATQFEASTNKANYALVKVKLSTESVTYCTGQYNLSTMLPQQFQNLQAQHSVLLEQIEGQRAQTMDNRTDGSVVSGVMGKQKALYSQQITSYMRDAEVKAGKLWTDAFTVMKTIDEGLIPPTNFNNANIDEVLSVIKTNNGF